MEYRLVGMRPKAILARKWLHWSKRGAVAGIIERESVHTTTSLKSSHRSFPSGGRLSKPGERHGPRLGHFENWLAHRYSRPTFSQGLKMPSIEYCGFHCEAVLYALPIGVYQMKIYQVEGNAALVSDFSTWSISPTVIVK